MEMEKGNLSEADDGTGQVSACVFYAAPDVCVFHLVILNQSTSAQPPSLAMMAGRVQNMPIFVPIHFPSLA